MNLDSASKIRFDKLHPHMQRVLELLWETDKYLIDQSERTREEQWAAFNKGTSKIKGDQDYPHMPRPGGVQAVDLRPIIKGKPIPWSLTVERGAQWAWFMRRLHDEAEKYFDALALSTGERWYSRFGLNWNGDDEILTDQLFDDYPHWEIHL